MAADALLVKGSGKGPEAIRGADSRLVERREADWRISGRTRVGTVGDLLTSTQLAERVGLETASRFATGSRRGGSSAGGGPSAVMSFPPSSSTNAGVHSRGLIGSLGNLTTLTRRGAGSQRRTTDWTERNRLPFFAQARPR